MVTIAMRQAVRELIRRGSGMRDVHRADEAPADTDNDSGDRGEGSTAALLLLSRTTRKFF
jgi:hypothetical protein